MNKVKLVFAVGGNDIGQFVDFAFGNKGGLPWATIKEDLEIFREVTKNDVLIMGARTFMSLPRKLKGRVHVVLSNKGERVVTKNGERPDIIIGKLDISSIVDYVAGIYPEHDISIIGGKQIILDAIDRKVADEIYLNIIYPSKENFECDVSFSPNQLAFHSKGYIGGEPADTITINRDNVDYILTELWTRG